MNKYSIEFFANRLLRNTDKEFFQPLIDIMFGVCPEMMSRKIPEANIQQAFTLYCLQKTINQNSKILCVGSFEDTSYEFLKLGQYNIYGIDPSINFDLHTFSTNSLEKYDIIFSTSVIEHVKNDDEFIEDICKLLIPGGLAILTCDFKEEYKKGDPLPNTDIRFYTEYDLKTRLSDIVLKNNCELISESNWKGEPDFLYQGHYYSFATLVFKRKENIFIAMSNILEIE